METRCRYFNGYKPCDRNTTCDAACGSRDLLSTSILIIHLGAMGAVVRSTALLAGIRRKYPNSQITWVTDAPMDQFLRGHKQIDHVLVNSHEGLLALRGRAFDVALVIDKSAAASGILAMTKANEVFGFVTEPQFGKIRPATPAAEELYALGLSNHKKFFVNQKTENQLVFEALELGDYRRERYDFSLTPDEQTSARLRHQEWQVHPDQPVIAFNTGCGPLMPTKKWTVAFHRQVIQRLFVLGYENIVLLGGPEDEARNFEIARGMPVICSPCRAGLRDGAVSIAACDIVLSGDSFGMHLAIALDRFVVAWFGPSCIQEIDLFDHGVKLQAQIACSPCWKRSCEREQNGETMCYESVSVEQIERALCKVAKDWQKERSVLRLAQCKQPEADPS